MGGSGGTGRGKGHLLPPPLHATHLGDGVADGRPTRTPLLAAAPRPARPCRGSRVHTGHPPGRRGQMENFLRLFTVVVSCFCISARADPNSKRDRGGGAIVERKWTYSIPTICNKSNSGQVTIILDRVSRGRVNGAKSDCPIFHYAFSLLSPMQMISTCKPHNLGSYSAVM